MAEQPCPQRRELVARGIWPQALDVLGLPSGALRRRDEGPGTSAVTR